MAERYICIHGHFYQPPRDNPWLEAVEVQDSAFPYHDWNERITAECYAPNTAARIVDPAGWITGIVNNYEKISFNFGPTLLSWLETQAPCTYQAILEADRQSRERFGGHGSAMAQGYNHMILPLANERDRHTQVLWGARDFEHRFDRRPEGMWLPETAVNTATLEDLARAGIRFTVLAPHQALRFRRRGEREWKDARVGGIDTRRPYVVNLPSGRQINVFFYDGPISQAVAFTGLLNNGEQFAHHMADAFARDVAEPQLVQIATDGETYGHHHRHGEMALAFALDLIERNHLARLTNYGQYLALNPPDWEAEIVENTAWSCSHGVERWRSDCGCASGGNANWRQGWRLPLRAALDWLRDEAASLYEAEAGELLRDPWSARDDYIAVILDRSPDNVAEFLRRQAARELDERESVSALKLLEIQRNAMLMYTSCGWFFDEVSGIETVQVLAYAGRVAQLAYETGGIDLEPELLARLALAKSNIASEGDAAQIYSRQVKPAVIGLHEVAAHYAVSSLFESYEPTARVYCYTARAADYRAAQTGGVKLAVGRALFTSDVTWESADLSFAVVHFGDQNLSGGVREYHGEQAYGELVAEVQEAFERADLPKVIRLLDSEFDELTYSLHSLFRDEQRKVLEQVLRSALDDAERAYREVYEHHAPLARFLSHLDTKPPAVFKMAAEVVLNKDLSMALARPVPDLERIRELLAGVRTWRIDVDEGRLRRVFEVELQRTAEEMRAHPDDPSLVERMSLQMAVLGELPFEVDLWSAQNTYFDLLRTFRSQFWLRSELAAAGAPSQLDRLIDLGKQLGLRVSEMQEIESVPTLADVIREVAGKPRIPRATYRLQFGPSFTFRQARELVGYLQELGISDCYTSPIFKASPDSEHGYDVTDHSVVNPDLGGQAEFDALAATLRDRGIGLILDIVPNHMGIAHSDNLLWFDVLENGPASVYAAFFDVDWHPVKQELENKVLLPILEDQYGVVLESGKLRLGYNDGSFHVTYYEKRLPLDPRTYSAILSLRLPNVTVALGEENEQVLELRSILTALTYLPRTSETDPGRVAERHREKEVIKRRIAALYDGSPEIRGAVEEALHEFNGIPGDPSSFDRLDQLLDEQAFRPAYWRVAAEEINYRRFFDVNNLAAIRVELPEVLEHTHQMVFRMLREGQVTGLRIDHPDGLWNPTAYLYNLQQRYVAQRVEARISADGAPDNLSAAVDNYFEQELQRAAAGRVSWPLYVVAEKILGDDEPMSEEWAVYGTTGYDFLNEVGGLFVEERNAAAFERVYGAFTQRDTNYGDLVNSSKKMIMLISLASEINGLSHRIERLSEQNRRYRDFTRNSLTFAIREIIAGLPVYRTYVTGENGSAKERDATYIRLAVTEAKRRNQRTAESIFDFLGDTLLLSNLESFSPEDRPALISFVMKFQQVTGPVMAKGVEDTAFYIYNKLVSLNEVGGHPHRFGVSPALFHAANETRLARWPHSMLTTSTHDTKRSEDVRARINVLSELPGEWRGALTRWNAWNEDKKRVADGAPAPSRNDEYLLYETLIGAWPEEDGGEGDEAEFRERIASYMLKAVKEAKVHTSWVNPNEAYDSAVQEFVRHLLSEKDALFYDDLRHFQRRVAYFGRFNSLSQLLLKLTAPGVPDIYRGAELWDFSLVDPDNRRPVDYERRRAVLGELRGRIEAAGPDVGPLANDLLQSSHDGRIKLYVLYRTLGVRRLHATLYNQGEYRPLRAVGPKHNHVCAFARAWEERAIITVVPRLVVGLTGGAEKPPLGEVAWEHTYLVLPGAKGGTRYRNIFTGAVFAAQAQGTRVQLPMAEVLATFPVALLERVD